MNETTNGSLHAAQEFLPSIPYIRVGTAYYRIVDEPQADGSSVRKLLKWERQTIILDHDKDYLKHIPCYHGFCMIPAHIGYMRDIKGFYNLYEPLPHELKDGPWTHIRQLVEHIFGNQYEMGLDYIQLLYTAPIKKLPILLLVSSERNTGKTTFLNFLKSIFVENATFNTNEDFRNKFNDDWAGRLLIMIDEAFLSRREDSERLKTLSTAKTYKMESKGKDRREIGFFGKFVMCSNNTKTPVIIDPEETRYWVRRIVRLSHDDTHFIDHVREEIPTFLHYLSSRELFTKESSRMWFSPSDIRTEALEQIKNANRDSLEMEILEVIKDLMVCTAEPQYCFCVSDLEMMLHYNNIKCDRLRIRHVLKSRWGLEPAPNALSYKRWYPDHNISSGYAYSTQKGRFYTIEKSFIESVDILLNC